MLWVEPMGNHNHDERKRHPDDELWRRIREATYKAVYALFKPPPQDVLGRAERDWKREEEEQCQDEANEKR